jgi:spore maturation protein CgeB
MRGDWYDPKRDGYVNEGLFEMIRRHRPRVVFCVKARCIRQDTLERIRRAGIRTAGYWIDDPLLFEESMKNALYYDLYFTNDKSSVEAYRSRGVEVLHLPSAASPQHFFPMRVRKRYDVSFVGTCSGGRQERLAVIRSSTVDTFGPGWRKKAPYGVRSHREVFGDRTNRVYNESRINLNLHTWFGVGSAMNLRLFEVPLAGQFLLTDWISEIDGEFEPGRHIEIWRTPEELDDKIRFYLAKPESAERIGAAGREHVLSRHTYRNRVQIIRNIIRI